MATNPAPEQDAGDKRVSHVTLRIIRADGEVTVTEPGDDVAASGSSLHDAMTAYADAVCGVSDDG